MNAAIGFLQLALAHAIAAGTIRKLGAITSVPASVYTDPAQDVAVEARDMPARRAGQDEGQRKDKQKSSHGTPFLAKVRGLKR